MAISSKCLHPLDFGFFQKDLRGHQRRLKKHPIRNGLKFESKQASSEAHILRVIVQACLSHPIRIPLSYYVLHIGLFKRVIILKPAWDSPS